MFNYFQFLDTQALDEQIKMERIPFNKNLFWDCDIDDIDLKTHQRYIIERVLMRGFTNDFYMLLKIYSTSEIKKALRKSKELDAKTIHFCSKYFKLRKSEMHVSSFYS